MLIGKSEYQGASDASDDSCIKKPTAGSASTKVAGQEASLRFRAASQAADEAKMQRPDVVSVVASPGGPASVREDATSDDLMDTAPRDAAPGPSGSQTPDARAPSSKSSTIERVQALVEAARCMKYQARMVRHSVHLKVSWAEPEDLAPNFLDQVSLRLWFWVVRHHPGATFGSSHIVCVPHNPLYLRLSSTWMVLVQGRASMV